MVAAKKSEIAAALRSQVLKLEGFKPSNILPVDKGLQQILDTLPLKGLPSAAVHEFIFSSREEAVSSSAFICGLIRCALEENAAALWISNVNTLFPPALKSCGVSPDRFIFLEINKPNDALWVMEESLKCPALSAVIAEVKDLSFNSSRRLQLAVEKSRVTGFVLRNTTKPGTTACYSRWRISPLPSIEIVSDGHALPGIGFPSWKVELLRIRNGKPLSWNVYWKDNSFRIVEAAAHQWEVTERKKTG